MKIENIEPKDINISYCRDPDKPKGSWNTTPDNGICIMHIPTGIIKKYWKERSAHQNKNKALELLVEELNHINWDGSDLGTGIKNLNITNNELSILVRKLKGKGLSNSQAVIQANTEKKLLTLLHTSRFQRV